MKNRKLAAKEEKRRRWRIAVEIVEEATKKVLKENKKDK